MISVTILAKNSEETIRDTLESVKEFPEVLLYDTGSTDRTIEIARGFTNVQIVEAPFEGFGPTHNKATAAAKHDWILSLDSDEALTPKLAEEILQKSLDKECVYAIDRHNYFNGKWIKGCAGWYPDPVVRLYNRTMTRFTDDEVHEKVISDKMKVIDLERPMVHVPYRTISDFLRKMESYSTLFVKQKQGKKKASLLSAVWHGFFAFFKSYILKRGILCGKEGFIISLYNGHTGYYKYLKLSMKT